MCLNISFQNAKQQGNVTHFSVNKIRSLWKARKKIDQKDKKDAKEKTSNTKECRE